MTQDSAKPPTQKVHGATIRSSVELFPPTVHTTFTYAPEWFEDAIREARVHGHRARRREIVFAVCAAETALFEWVRDSVLLRDFVTLSAIFPAGKKRGVIDKYREIPKELAKQGRISAPLDCGGSEFEDFRRLVAYRDGLIHAAASRPDRVDLERERRPVPTKDELDTLTPGWALGIVRTVLKKLHNDTGTPVPTWIAK